MNIREKLRQYKIELMTHFDETSGTVPCQTPWGQWWQTMEEVGVEIHLPEGTTAKQIKCTIKPKSVSVKVGEEVIIQGDLPEAIQADDAVWTVEDKKRLQIILPKTFTTADHCWRSLLKGQYEVDAWTHDQMQKKLTLQRFQFENPGFDFSNADISGNYQGGGPQLPT